jgi:hypothetical protein
VRIQKRAYGVPRDAMIVNQQDSGRRSSSKSWPRLKRELGPSSTPPGVWRHTAMAVECSKLNSSSFWRHFPSGAEWSCRPPVPGSRKIGVRWRGG